MDDDEQMPYHGIIDGTHFTEQCEAICSRYKVDRRKFDEALEYGTMRAAADPSLYDPVIDGTEFRQIPIEAFRGLPMMNVLFSETGDGRIELEWIEVVIDPNEPVDG